MLSLIRRPIGPGGRRRGVTLVEMLVVVALVVLMMVILVQIFQTATGAMSASRTIQELDVNLRQVDSIIRSDLNGVTAKMTPPNDPKDKRGYFEYGENAFADAQGEDTDDYIAFTTKAPEGQVFSGRQWLAPTSSSQPPINQNIQPTTINSQTAEVIYFLRNGNLYRRIFLVAPDRAKNIVRGTAVAGDFQFTYFLGLNYTTSLFGNKLLVSWQGMNDISCRPGGFNSTSLPQLPIPNDLGDLTNRENRAFHPRFINDFSGPSGVSDGIPDDLNADGLPDYYPTLYTDATGKHGNAPNVYVDPGTGTPGNPYGNYFTSGVPFNSGGRQIPASYNVYAFPFIYPYMYSVPDQTRLKLGANLGWIHSLLPATDATSGHLVLNHGALDVGENLFPLPTGKQTWWGFPTWRETIAGYKSNTQVGWTDPFQFVGATPTSPGVLAQPIGLIPLAPDQPFNVNNLNFLPQVTVAETGNSPPFADTTAGSASFIAINPPYSNRVWEDELLLTGVRSFDVKAYDLNAPLYNTNANASVNGLFSAGYQDLGYGSIYYERTGIGTNDLGSFNYLGGPNGIGATNQQNVLWQSIGSEPQGFGHEGRMPPVFSDFRPHPRRGYNIGDDATGVIRLTRVWDSWSTDYTNAPDSDIFLNNYSSSSVASYPSFPAPYPSPLRGIQIQIRLVDPRGEKAKSITIRHDFTDKL